MVQQQQEEEEEEQQQQQLTNFYVDSDARDENIAKARDPCMAVRTALKEFKCKCAQMSLNKIK